MRGTRTYCSSACPLSYAQGNRHLLQHDHSHGDMGITRPLISTQKRNGMRNANSLHNLRSANEAAELILRNQAARTDEKFPGIIQRQSPTRFAAWARERVFLHTVWCRQRWWSSEATEVPVRRIWRVPSESEQAWAWFYAKRTCFGRCEARISVYAIFLDVAGRWTHRASSMSLVIKKVGMPVHQPSSVLGH